jgi:long-chain acyl-CoA synthetase
VRGLFAGGAPPSPALFAFFESLRIPLVELYGMTETAGMIASNLWAGPRRPGCVGLPTPDLELRFAEDGELLIRGATLMTGYLDPEDDAAAFAPDGFFRTGDLARLEPDGWLVVEGRKKNLLMLSTGKKLAPEPIEQAMGAAPFTGVMLLGEGRPYVAAAVFVTEPDLRRLGASGREPAAVLLELVRARLQGFSEHEKPKRLLVMPGTPQEHPGLLTPTLKLRRAAVMERIQVEVERLYAAPRAT